jgi:hypothetical protein
MAYFHVIDHVLIVGTGFIMHTPPCIQELQPLLPNQPPDNTLPLLCLLFPPHREKLHFHIRKLPLRVLDQGVNHCVNYHMDVCDLDVSAHTVIIPVYGL